MKVKAVRKGYSKGLKQPGDVFEYEGTKCPSWCEKVQVKRVMKENKKREA